MNRDSALALPLPPAARYETSAVSTPKVKEAKNDRLRRTWV